MIDLFQADWRAVWDGAEDRETVGSIFTKPEIVDLILDLAGYNPESRALDEFSVLEPSCGDGAFTSSLVRRLVASARRRSGGKVDWRSSRLPKALRACDLSKSAVERARATAIEVLIAEGCPRIRAAELASIWIFQTDFLLHPWSQSFDFVVGNPPYVRIEDLPPDVLRAYRATFETTSDRADLYVAFVERGLSLLSERGTLGFICANRFTKNLYGRKLRNLIAARFRVRHYLNLEHTQPFLADVSAYPAIFVFDRERGSATTAATLGSLEEATLQALRTGGGPWARFAQWYPDGGPWTTTSSREFERLACLEALPLLEESAANTKVGIGVATGADDVFVLKPGTDIESELTLPLLMAQDVGNDEIVWSGRRLLNPFVSEDDGSLVDLARFPRAAAHIAKHKETLKARHVARNREAGWYRTIDRIWPSLVNRPKLLLPDIQTGVTVGYDDGQYYPHHNLYWITSDGWDLRALKALMRSEQVVSQVRAFSVHMRGGALRFQAQTLRKLRLPASALLSKRLVARLSKLSDSNDLQAIDKSANEAFGTAGIEPVVGKS